MLKYLLELFEIYAPCKPWGQNIIQEALLVAMAGTPPPWDLSLPCAGQRFSAFPRDVLEGIEAKCAPEKDSMKDCVLSRAAAHMNATCNGRYSSMVRCTIFWLSGGKGGAVCYADVQLWCSSSCVCVSCSRLRVTR